jgi:hypothetical protein
MIAASLSTPGCCAPCELAKRHAIAVAGDTNGEVCLTGVQGDLGQQQHRYGWHQVCCRQACTMQNSETHNSCWVQPQLTTDSLEGIPYMCMREMHVYGQHSS